MIEIQGTLQSFSLKPINQEYIQRKNFRINNLQMILPKPPGEKRQIRVASANRDSKDEKALTLQNLNLQGHHTTLNMQQNLPTITSRFSKKNSIVTQDLADNIILQKKFGIHTQGTRDSSLVRNHTSPDKLVYNSFNPQAVQAKIPKCPQPIKSFPPSIDIPLEISVEEKPETFIYQDPDICPIISHIPSAKTKIIYSSSRKLKGNHSLIIIRQQLLFRNYPTWWKKDHAQYDTNLKTFVTGLRKHSICGLLLSARYKQQALNSNCFDGLDFVAQVLPTDFSTYQNRTSLENQIMINIQSILDVFSCKANPIKNVYILDNFNFSKDNNVSCYQHRIPRADQLTDRILMNILWLHERDCISDLNREQINRISSFVGVVLNKHKDLSSVYPESLQRFYLKEVFQKTLEGVKQAAKRDQLFKHLDECKLLFRRKTQSHPPGEENIDFAAEKQAEAFRDLMVQKIKNSKQKVQNMYFTVGDVVQRNIHLFRNFERSPFQKEQLKNKFIHDSMVKFEEKPLNFPYEETNHHYFALKIPEHIYKK